MLRVLSSLLAVFLMAANMMAAPVPSTPKSGATGASGSKTLPKASKTNNSRKAPYQIGIASWYGKQFHGKSTANGEAFDMFELTAAHRQLPLGTYVKVTNLRNGKWIVVRINDRGPYVAGRIMDLSYGAARMLGFYSGIERVRLDLVKPETVAFARTY